MGTSSDIRSTGRGARPAASPNIEPNTDTGALIQIGWRSRLTGEICDCPVYERSPHATSDPVYVA